MQSSAQQSFGQNSRSIWPDWYGQGCPALAAGVVMVYVRLFCALFTAFSQLTGQAPHLNKAPRCERSVGEKSGGAQVRGGCG